MDITSMLDSEKIVPNLKASGFSLGDGDNLVARLREQKTSISTHIPQTQETPRPCLPEKSITHVETPILGSSSSIDPRDARKVMREHI